MWPPCLTTHGILLWDSKQTRTAMLEHNPASGFMWVTLVSIKLVMHTCKLNLCFDPWLSTRYAHYQCTKAVSFQLLLWVCKTLPNTCAFDKWTVYVFIRISISWCTYISSSSSSLFGSLEVCGPGAWLVIQPCLQVLYTPHLDRGTRILQ